MDEMIWYYDIMTRFSPTSLSYSSVTHQATAIISGVTTISMPKVNAWLAYRHLRCKLLKISDEDCSMFHPELTTAQINLLTVASIISGFGVWNVTTNSMNVCEDGTWATTSAGLFGSMYENNASGSVVGSGNGTITGWTSAIEGPSNSNFEFVNNAGGDRIKILVAGTYPVWFHTSFTGANNVSDVRGAIYKNGTITSILDNRIGHSSRQRTISALGNLICAVDDYIDLHLVSTTLSTETIKVYNTHVLV